MTYEMKQIAIDPFDIMCGECVEHEIEYWKEVTEEELREEHNDQIGADRSMPEWEKKMFAEEYDWKPTTEDFDVWLQEVIAEGYVRIV